MKPCSRNLSEGEEGCLLSAKGREDSVILEAMGDLVDGCCHSQMGFDNAKIMISHSTTMPNTVIH